MKLICLLCLTLLLTGCGGQFKRVESAPVLVRGSMEVQAGGDWNHHTPYGSRHREMWTQHGVPIDLLTFFSGVADGVALDDLAPRNGKPPLFRRNMSPEDIVGLVETMLAGNGGQFQLQSLAPDTVSDSPGFRFEYLYTARSQEVERAGIGRGAVIGDRLYLMLFDAPRGRYFDRGRPGAERLMDSLRVVPQR